jgi:FkbM family methyltransferase
MRAVFDFRRRWEDFGPALQADAPAVRERIVAAESEMRSPAQVRRALVEVACEENEILIAGGRLRFAERDTLPTLIEEIFVREEYYFETDTDAPRIIDAGAHCGFATYYFKRLFPKARIVAFEPAPELFEIARKNVERNELSDVELHQVALSNRVGTVEMRLPGRDSMGGSIVPHKSAPAETDRVVTVECDLLSRHLTEPTHYLKMDIEGMESRALVEAREGLGNVQHVFVEYHRSEGAPLSELSKMMKLLESRGFALQVGKSINTQSKTAGRPMLHTRARQSLVIWGVNRRWKKGASRIDGSGVELRARR